MKHRTLTFLLAVLMTQSALAQSPKSTTRPVSKSLQAKSLPLAAGVLGDIQLTQVRLDDAARLLSQIGKINIVVTGKVAEQIVSLYLRTATAEDIVRNLCRAAGVWYRYDSASKTYVIMSGEEYQKDLAIVRDEQTQIFTLRHHNVVATANAIKALFGSRVQLNIPVEEMPPTSLGSGNRSSTSAGNKGNSTAGGSTSGISGGASFERSPAVANANTGGGSANYDPSADLKRMSQDRLSRQSSVDASGQPVLSLADIQGMAANQAPPVYVTYNKLNNLLMVRTGDELSLKQIAKLVGDMDKPPRQVLLEMKIIEVTLDNGFKSVFDIGTSGQGTTTGPLPSGSLPSTTSNYARNSLATGLFDVEQDATAIWQIMSNSLSLRFQLLAQENKLKVLSSPMLVAANNQPARLFIGDERVLTVGASSQSITGTTGATNTQITVETEKRDVGQTLSILPRINGDRSVSLTIDQDSSTVKLKDATIPIATADGKVFYFPIDTVNTANLQVTAHAQDGMTVAIGGMIRDSLQLNEEKVPLLGDIPLFGTLFKRDVRASVRSQIVLLITPRVLENPEESRKLAQMKTQDFEALSRSIPDKPVIPTFAQMLTSPVTPEPIESVDSHVTNPDFAALARAAATAVRQQDPTLAAPEGLIPVAISDQTLKMATDLELKPVASWQRDGWYVSALQITNTGSQPSALLPARIRGRWAAIVLENSSLDAADSANSWTWAYVISRQPFEQAVE